MRRHFYIFSLYFRFCLSSRLFEWFSRLTSTALYAAFVLPLVSLLFPLLRVHISYSIDFSAYHVISLFSITISFSILFSFTTSFPRFLFSQRSNLVFHVYFLSFISFHCICTFFIFSSLTLLFEWILRLFHVSFFVLSFSRLPRHFTTFLLIFFRLHALFNVISTFSLVIFHIWWVTFRSVEWFESHRLFSFSRIIFSFLCCVLDPSYFTFPFWQIKTYICIIFRLSAAN